MTSHDEKLREIINRLATDAHKHPMQMITRRAADQAIDDINELWESAGWRWRRPLVRSQNLWEDWEYQEEEVNGPATNVQVEELYARSNPDD